MFISSPHHLPLNTFPLPKSTIPIETINSSVQIPWASPLAQLQLLYQITIAAHKHEHTKKILHFLQ